MMSEVAAIPRYPAQRFQMCNVTTGPPILQTVALVPLLFFSILLTFATEILLFATDLLSARGLVAFLSAEIALIVAASFLLGWAQGHRFDLFEPCVVVNLVFLLYYCVRPLYLMSSFGLNDSSPFVSMNPATAIDFAWATGYSVVALLCFHTGYHAMRDRFRGATQLQPSVRRWSSYRVTRVVVVGGLWAITSAALTVYFAGGIAGTVANVGHLREVTAGDAYLLLGTIFFPIGTVLLFADHLLGHPHRFWTTFFFVLTVAYSAFFGNRTGMIAIVVSCLILYVYLRGIKKPWRLALFSAATALVVVPVIVFLGFARDFQVGLGELPEIAHVMRDKAPGFFYQQMMGEFSAVDAFAAVLHGGSSIFPFRYGGTYLDTLLFIVPRTIWPNKPQAFSTAVGDYVTEDGDDVPPGVVGELYVNFHIFGLVTGMLLLGMLLGALYCRAVSGGVGALALYALFVPYFGVFLTRNFLGGGILLLVVLLPMLPAVFYIEAAHRGKHRIDTSRTSRLTNHGEPTTL
jgi:oligosaccharide repeat unit polymerase